MFLTVTSLCPAGLKIKKTMAGGLLLPEGLQYLIKFLIMTGLKYGSPGGKKLRTLILFDSCIAINSQTIKHIDIIMDIRFLMIYHGDLRGKVA